MPSPILRAVLDGDEATAESLLAADDTKLLVNSDDEDMHLSLLGWAAHVGDRDMVELLIRFGAVLESKDVGGRTPLLWAAAEGNAPIVELLIDLGANIEAQTMSGNTALSRAAAYGHADVARVLLLAGARLESTNTEGLTPLHRACRWGHPDVVDVLVSSGAFVSATDSAGLTPRDWAVKKGHQSIPALLVQQVLPWQPARMDSSGIAAAPTMSVSSLESSADSGLHASASSFAAAAATATSAAARRPSLYQAPPMITDMFDDEESRDVVPVPAGAASLARPQDDSPWDKLAIFGRRSSISFKPRHVEGYLCKQGGIVRSWKVRYFVLSETKLSYFGKQELKRVRLQGDRKAKGSADLTIDSIVEQDLQSGRQYCFNLITRSRKYLFEAKNKEEMELWMSAIAHNISGLLLG